MKDSTGTIIDLCKDSTCVLSILEKLVGAGINRMDVSSTSTNKARKLCWKKEHRAVFPYGINGIVGDKPKKAETHVNVGTKISIFLQKISIIWQK